MKYKRFGSRMVLRIDRGEEVLTQLHRAAEQEGIRLAAVSGLGAVGDFTVGVFTRRRSSTMPTAFRGILRSSRWWGPSPPRTGSFMPTST